MIKRSFCFLGFVFLALGLLAAAPDGAAPAGKASAEELIRVIRAGDLSALQALVAKEPALVHFSDSQGRTLLHGAAAGGRLEMIRWLIAKGAEVDGRSVQMATPLMLAALSGSQDTAGLLIANGADVEARDAYGRTALVLVARERGDTGMAKALLDAGANIDAPDRNQDSALSLAAWRGYTALVDLLLERGAKLPSDPARQRALFALAVAKGLDRLFDRLLDAGSEPMAAGGNGGSMLHAAANGGSEHILNTLLARDPAVSARDGNGWTPLHFAAERGHARAAAALLGHGAELNARNLAGESAYNLASAEKNEVVTALLRARGADTGQPAFPLLKGDYLGQKKPGAKPELFAPGIVSSRFGLHCPATFSPDGREAYWNLMITPRGSGYSISRLLVSRRKSGRWTHPETAPFTDKDRDADVPFFTPDGKRLYFMSRRPMPPAGDSSGEHIWFMERQRDGWSEARPVDEAVNRFPHHWQFSLDRDYNLYFSTTVADGKGGNDIYVAPYVNGHYQEPRNLGAPVNTPDREEMPFIAADGSYLLIAREMDLFASFRLADGSWSEAVSLGPEINSPAVDICPMVSADGKYLFFLSQRGGESHAWWVEARVIEALRPKALEEQGPEPELRSLTSFDQIDDLAAEYFAEDRMDKAIAAFEYAKSRFPAEMATIVRRLTAFYAMTKQFDKVMDNWELGQSMGLFFRTGSKMFEPLFQSDRYQKFLVTNERLLEEARKNAKAEYAVVLPSAYDPGKKYPVFIVLHGNNISTAVIKPKWKLGNSAGRFILAFLQSSQVTGSESFIWDDLPTGRRDIAEYYAWLRGNYKIDETRVLIGGFSGGATMAIDAALRQVIPAGGFIALCPGGVLPGRADMEIFREAAGKNIKGQIIAGEKDDPQEAQALADLFAEAGLHVGLTVVSGLGHDFPADLPKRLDAAVGIILEK